MKAFTIVELVVVITVLGILAAVTVIGYNGYQNSVKNAQAKNVLGDTHKKLNSYKRTHGAYPASLNEIEIASEDGITYHPLESIGWFCLSVSVDGSDISYYNTSMNSAIQDGDCDSVDVIAGKPAGFIDDPQDTTKTIDLITPITGHPDITMYVVFDIFDTDSAYQPIARLWPSITNQQIFGPDVGPASSSALRYRVDTSNQANATSNQTNARTIGRHIGWISVKNGLTIREFAYDKTDAHTSLALSPGDDWNFTQLALFADSSSQKGITVVVYNAAHNESTRKLVMTWLADKYDVPLSF